MQSLVQMFSVIQSCKVRCKGHSIDVVSHIFDILEKFLVLRCDVCGVYASLSLSLSLSLSRSNR